MKGYRRSFRYSFLFGDIWRAYIIDTGASVGKIPPKAAVFHPHPGMLGGRMPYAPTLTDEWIPEDRLVIPFPQRKRSGGSIGNPILSAITY